MDYVTHQYQHPGSVSLHWVDFACTNPRHYNYKYIIGVYNRGDDVLPAIVLSGELCSVWTTCSAPAFFLCVPTFLATTCRVIIISTLPRYTPPSSIKRTLERYLSLPLGRKIASFGLRAVLIPFLEPHLCMLCTSFIITRSESHFLNVHPFVLQQAQVRRWDDFCGESWPTKFIYRYLNYRHYTRCRSRKR